MVTLQNVTLSEKKNKLPITITILRKSSASIILRLIKNYKLGDYTIC